MNRERYLALINPAIALVVRKAEDYNDGPSLHDYFPFRDKSYIQMIHLKALRLVSLADNPKPNFEGTLDTLYDLLNYTAFYLDYLEQKCQSSNVGTSSLSAPSSQAAHPEQRALDPHYNALAQQSLPTSAMGSQSSLPGSSIRKVYGENSPLS